MFHIIDYLLYTLLCKLILKNSDMINIMAFSARKNDENSLDDFSNINTESLAIH